MEGSIKGTVPPGRLTTHQGPISKNKATIQARFDGEIQEKKERKKSSGLFDMDGCESSWRCWWICSKHVCEIRNCVAEDNFEVLGL